MCLINSTTRYVSDFRHRERIAFSHRAEASCRHICSSGFRFRLGLRLRPLFQPPPELYRYTTGRQARSDLPALNPDYGSRQKEPHSLKRHRMLGSPQESSPAAPNPSPTLRSIRHVASARSSLSAVGLSPLRYGSTITDGFDSPIA